MVLELFRISADSVTLHKEPWDYLREIMETCISKYGVSHEKVLKILEIKNHDYGGAFQDFGIIGILIRIQDKLRRLERQGGYRVDESFMDTVHDLYGYCLLGLQFSPGQDVETAPTKSHPLVPMESVVLYTKRGGGCPDCQGAEDLLDQCDVQLDIREVTGEQLRLIFDTAQIRFPQLRIGDRWVGGYDRIVQTFTEDLLRPNGDDRFVYVPKYPRLAQLFEAAQASFWMTKEISFREDGDQFEKLTQDEQDFIGTIIKFFAASDGLVGESLNERIQELQLPEARAFLTYQAYNESVHSETYSQILEALYTDPVKRERVLREASTDPCIVGKKKWAIDWISPRLDFALKLVAWTCVEMIFFSSSFCALFWIKRKGVLPNVCFSNELISRDESLHGEFTAEMFRTLKTKPDAKQVNEIVCGAVEEEIRFVRGALKVDVVGMKAAALSEHVKYMGDRVLVMLGYPRVYNVESPYMDLCERQSLQGETNFFEKTVGDYARAQVVVGEFGDANDL
jgi:ribonucleoside-diphosphate reductase subunit M2